MNNDTPRDAITPTIRVGGLQSGVAPVCLPMEMFAPFNEQAKSNHGGQSLLRLEERGGVSWCEALAILENRRWQPISQEEARQKVMALFAAWNTRTTSLAAQDGLVERIVRDVAELPDRTSPEDWPDAMLVTADELAAIVEAALASIEVKS